MNIFKAISQRLWPIPSSRGVIRESFTSAWQQGIELKDQQSLLKVSTIHACINRIANDVGKLGAYVTVKKDGIYQQADQQPLELNKPNHYQTFQQFITQWLISKLVHGNTYILHNGNGWHILDAQTTQVMIAEDGSVFYQVAKNLLAGTQDGQHFSARNIAHDRFNCLHHDLVGTSPLYACTHSGTVASNIQSNSAAQFGNNSRPSGILMPAEGGIEEPAATTIQDIINKGFSGNKSGQIAVIGGKMVFTPLNVNAADSQLIEQLNFTVQDICRAFNMPLYKIDQTVQTSAGTSIEAINQSYYSDCLQAHIESIEACLDEILQHDAGRRIEFDLPNLLRLDAQTRANINAALVGGGIKTINEARKDEGLPPVDGGDDILRQMQDIPLAEPDKQEPQQNEVHNDSGVKDVGTD